jgi:hypothetical protein
MIPLSSCPLRQPDKTGQTSRRAQTRCRSYTTPWGTIHAEYVSPVRDAHLPEESVRIERQLERRGAGGKLPGPHPTIPQCRADIFDAAARETGTDDDFGNRLTLLQ